MNRILQAVFILALVAMIATNLQAGDWDKDVLYLPIGTTDATGTAATGMVRFPRAVAIDSVYVTDVGGIASNATDFASVTMYLDNAANGGLDSKLTGWTAVTPRALTPTTSTVSAGSTIDFRVTKSGSGVATTNLGVTVVYHDHGGN